MTGKTVITFSVSRASANFVTISRFPSENVRFAQVRALLSGWNRPNCLAKAAQWPNRMLGSYLRPLA